LLYALVEDLPTGGQQLRGSERQCEIDKKRSLGGDVIPVGYSSHDPSVRNADQKNADQQSTRNEP